MSERFPPHVMDDEGAHRWFLPYLARLIGARWYLELGVMHGESLWPMVDGNPELRAVAVDCEGKFRLDHERVEAFAEIRTQDFFARIAPEHDWRFDLVLIDADHEEASVSADLTACLPYVREHGLICLHDTYPGLESLTARERCWTAWRVGERLGRGEWSELEAVTLPFSPGLTICRKRTKHLPEWITT